jgi:hypothetical protein
VIGHKQRVTHSKLLLIPAGFLAAATALTAIASADRPFPRKPPQQAIDACTNAKSGDACTFSMPARDGSGDAHTITGTCDTPPEQTTLACKPDHPLRHHRGSDDPPPPRD